MSTDDRAAIFRHHRDLPYRLTGRDPVTCLVKCHDLKTQLADVGISSEFAVGEFDWTTLAIPARYWGSFR